jgi:5-methylcytosine-specific restriction endonuclease McrA
MTPAMKNLKSLSNEVLLQNTQALVVEERKLTTQILWNLHEIQRRRLFAERGYGSLFEYAVQALGYSEAAAGRRIAAMRLLVEVPEIEPALQKGDVSLSTLSTIQHFFQRKEEQVSREEKKELVFALQGKSRRECEKELARLDPVAALPAEKERVVSPTQTEIRFVADDSLMEKLKAIRELDAHVLKDGTYLELLHRMADVVLKELGHAPGEKKSSKKAERREAAPPAELQETRSENPRHIPASVQRAVWARDQGRCSYISPDGRRCISKHALEIDHKIPIALGGPSTLSNLQLLCRAHNQFKAIRQLGEPVMRRYLRI